MNNTNMVQEVELLSTEERIKHISRVEVLDQVGSLLLLPNTELATTKQVAEFYKVDLKAIQWHIKENKNELNKNGMKMMKFAEIKEIISNTESNSTLDLRPKSLGVSPNGANIFTKRAILNIGMLLRDSTVAKEVRNQLLNIVENTSDEIKVKSIDDEMVLFANIIRADTQENQLIALGKLNSFHNRHVEKLETVIKEKESLVKEKTEVIQSLTSGIELVNKRQLLNKVIRKGGMYGLKSRWDTLYKKYDEINHCNISTRMKKHIEETGKVKMSKIDYIADVMGDFEGLFNLGIKMYANEAKFIMNEMTEVFKENDLVKIS